MSSFASRRLRAVLALVILLAVAGSFGVWLRSSSLVRVNDVTVAGAEGRQAAEIVDALSAAAIGMSTLDVAEHALRRAVSSYPAVRGLRTKADLPHGLRITVVTHRPVAALQSGGDLTAVAADGTLLRGSATSGLPVVGVRWLPAGDRAGDAGTLRALRLLAAAPAPLRRRIARVFRGTRGLAASVQDGPKLYFGGGERFAAKWSAAAHVLAHSGTQGARYVDLRIPERPVAGGYQPIPLVPQPQL
jgi:cell division protein FtsQ